MSRLIVPAPVQWVIDDVGWRDGRDLSSRGGPFRAGIERCLGPRDYAAIATLGKTLGMRPQCAMVLCEWDRGNVCARYPTTTARGSRWNNADRMGPWLEESVAVFRDNAAHMEFALHGVGHEHWENGCRTRAEWFGREGARRWPRATLEGHWECFRAIMAANGLGPDDGVSPPESFVPCAFHFLWNNADAESTGALMSSFGIRFASTPFSSCTFVEDEPLFVDGGFEHDLVVLDRGYSGIPWNVYDTLPTALPSTPICGIHWPNILGADANDTREAVRRWIAWWRALAADPERIPARSMAHAVSQWLWRRTTVVTAVGTGEWRLEATAMPAKARRLSLLQPLELSVPRNPGDPPVSMLCDNARLTSVMVHDTMTRFSLMPQPGVRAITVRLVDAAVAPPAPVLSPGTCDVLDVRPVDDGIEVVLRVYGRQRPRLCVPFRPQHVRLTAGGPAVRLESSSVRDGNIDVELVSMDLQGRKAVVTITP